MLKKGLLKIIRLYQLAFSNLKSQPSCKFYPICSNYSLEAIEKYGPLKGGLKSCGRILRCHPWSHGGVDKP